MRQVSISTQQVNHTYLEDSRLLANIELRNFGAC